MTRAEIGHTVSEAQTQAERRRAAESGRQRQRVADRGTERDWVPGSRDAAVTDGDGSHRETHRDAQRQERQRLRGGRGRESGGMVAGLRGSGGWRGHFWSKKRTSTGGEATAASNDSGVSFTMLPATVLASSSSATNRSIVEQLSSETDDSGPQLFYSYFGGVGGNTFVERHLLRVEATLDPGRCLAVVTHTLVWLELNLVTSHLLSPTIPTLSFH